MYRRAKNAFLVTYSIRIWKKYTRDTSNLRKHRKTRHDNIFQKKNQTPRVRVEPPRAKTQNGGHNPIAKGVRSGNVENNAPRDLIKGRKHDDSAAPPPRQGARRGARGGGGGVRLAGAPGGGGAGNWVKVKLRAGMT